jgi:hypothetical protein
MIVTLFSYECSPSIRQVTHFQLAVEHRYPNLNKKVCPLIRPTHLPLLRTTQTDNFIDRRFSDAAANRHAAPITPSIVDQILGIGFQVPIRPAQIPPERSVRRVLWRETNHVMEAFQSFDCFGTPAMPRQPFRGCDFIWY